MLFSTYDFIFLFLPLAVALRVVFWDSRFTQAPFAALVLLSLLFYGWWNPANLWIIIASILFNYVLGVLVQQRREPLLVVIGIAANLVFLGFFKYRNFVIENISLTAGFESAPTSLIIPLGISFFTFHQIAWLIESHQGRTKSRDFLRYCLFITFFPQLIAGPILRPSELIPQFDTRGDGKPLREHLVVGFSIFIVGLGKKVLIADRLSPFRGLHVRECDRRTCARHLECVGGPPRLHPADLFRFLRLFRHGDRARRMYGIDLPINFNSPYKARSVQDFWRRWHITLSTLSARLSLHPARRQCDALARQPARHHAARRPVARRELDIPGVGRPAWSLPRDQPALAADENRIARSLSRSRAPLCA